MTPTAQCAKHPERAATSVCPRCGAFTCGECNADGRSLCPSCQQVTGTSQAAIEPTPWERRDELGVVQGFFQTWKKSMLEPGRFCPSIDPNRPAADAFFYGWLISSVAGLTQIPFLILNFAQTQAQMQQLTSTMKDLPPPMRAFFDLFAGNPVVISVVVGLSAVVLFPLSALIATLLTHLGVRMVGASQYSFATTMRCVCYSMGPNLLQGIPVIGGFAGLYTLVLEVWTLRDTYQLTTGRAIIAVMWPVVLFCCCGVGFAFLFGAAAASKL